MASQTRNQRGLRKPAGTPEAVGVALVPHPRGDAAPCPCPRDPDPGPRQLRAVGAAAIRLEPEEVLVADPRGDLTPAQQVDNKLLALLPAGGPGLFIHAAGRLHDIRRIPGAEGTALFRDG